MLFKNFYQKLIHLSQQETGILNQASSRQSVGKYLLSKKFGQFRIRSNEFVQFHDDWMPNRKNKGKLEKPFKYFFKFSLWVDFQLRLKQGISVILAQLMALGFDEVSSACHILNGDYAWMSVELCRIFDVLNFVSELCSKIFYQIIRLHFRQ